MEPRFGHDFGNVRVHADAIAGDMANHIEAAAFTVGHDIYFAPSRYQPDTTRGRRLLGHELAHALQQTRNFVPGSAAETGTAEEEANHAAEQAVNERPVLVGSRLPVGVQRQTVANETAEAEKEAAAQVPLEAQATPEIGIGFQAWHVLKHHVDVNPPLGVELGPVSWTGFSFEAETNPMIGRFAGKGAARPEREGESGGGEREALTQIRVGKLIEKGERGTAFGVQAEIERAVLQKITAFGMDFQPKVKGGGKLTSEGAELGFEGKLEGKTYSGGVTFTFVEINWEKHEAKFNTGTGFVDVHTTISPDDLRKYVPLPELGDLDVALEVKIRFGFEFRPNYLWPGWRPIIAQAAQAVRSGVSAIYNTFVIAETGELTLAGAIGVAGAVVVAYVAFVGYGMYQVELSHQKGRHTNVLEAFIDGYANMLTLYTGPYAATQAQDEIRSLGLLDMPWQETLKQYIEAYVYSDQVLLERSPVYFAGEAAIAQDVNRYIRENGKEAWFAVTQRLQARFGESDPSRSRAIRAALRSQIASGATILGVSFQ
jgi:hypothetical protein